MLEVFGNKRELEKGEGVVIVYVEAIKELATCVSGDRVPPPVELPNADKGEVLLIPQTSWRARAGPGVTGLQPGSCRSKP